MKLAWINLEFLYKIMENSEESNKVASEVDSDSDGYIEEFSDEVHIPDLMALERKTTTYLTKYEKASVLGTRAL